MKMRGVMMVAASLMFCSLVHAEFVVWTDNLTVDGPFRHYWGSVAGYSVDDSGTTLNMVPDPVKGYINVTFGTDVNIRVQNGDVLTCQFNLLNAETYPPVIFLQLWYSDGTYQTASGTQFWGTGEYTLTVILAPTGHLTEVRFKNLWGGENESVRVENYTITRVPEPGPISVDGDISDWPAEYIFTDGATDGPGEAQMTRWGAYIDNGTLYGFVEMSKDISIYASGTNDLWAGLWIDADDAGSDLVGET